MKTKFTVLAIGMSLGINAQTFQEQTIELGASYEDDVYYDLTSATGEDEEGKNWHIAFGLGGADASIHFQSAWGSKLYKTSHNVSDWATIDTVGISGMTALINEPSSWGTGAFNQNPADPGSGFDMGWGTYDIVTHQVAGSAVFLAEIDADYYKIHIESLISGEYKFKYQKIESGSTVVEETIKKSDYAGMDMIHYDVVENEVVEREPSADWQFIIGKYTDFAPTPYPVVGVRIKQGMEVVKIANTHPNDVVLSGLTFTEEINTIGYNWKTFNMGTFSYEIADSTSYVIKEDNGAMHHFYFTEYEGSSTGVVKLMYKGHSVGTNEYAQEKMVALSKNPVSKNETFVLQSTHTMTSVNVYNTNGQLVQAISPELNQVDLQINNTGLYIIESVVNGEKQVNKLIVE